MTTCYRVRVMRLTIARRIGVGLLILWSAACGRMVNAGNAMAPTLQDGERLAVTSIVEPLERGDIVVFRYPVDESKTFVKRIVGLPGDEIGVVDGRVTVNGRLLEEPYVLAANRSSDRLGPYKVPDGQYFVVGDNRRNSSDSRHWGPVRRDLIVAKVTAP